MKRKYLLLAVVVLCLGGETTLAQPYVNATAIVSGSPNDTIDFGFIRAYHIGDFVWEDDGDGIQSDYERLHKGIKDVEVQLFENNIPKDITYTNDTGYYWFYVGNGTYEVRINMSQVKLAGMINTTPNVGPYDRDSNGIPAS